MTDRCSILNCRNPSTITLAFAKGASLCNEHWNKWCALDNAAPYPRTPEGNATMRSKVKAFIKDLREYSRFDDVDKFVDEKGGIITIKENTEETQCLKKTTPTTSAP